MFSREISSWDEIIPVYGEMSFTVYTFLPRWNFIPGYTHLCQKDRDEISSREEKKTCKHFIPGWNFKISMFFFCFLFFVFFFIFDVCIQICFPKLTCLNIVGVWIQLNIRPFHKKWSPKRKKMRITSKKSKTSKHFYYFFIFFGKFTKDWNFILL